MNGGRRSGWPKLWLFQLVLASLFLSGCGSFFVGFVSNPQIPNSTVSGRIAAAVLSVVTDANGNRLTITVVTFVNGGLANNANFCGDQRVQFPINATVRADFTNGTNCLSLVSVVILSTGP